MKLEEHLKIGAEMVTPQITTHVSASQVSNVRPTLLTTPSQPSTQISQKEYALNIRKVVAERNGVMCFQCLSMLAIIEMSMYLAEEEVLSIDGDKRDEVLSHWNDATDYIDKAKSRISKSLDLSEDELLDACYYIQKKLKRKLISTANAITKQAKGLGAEHADAVSKMSLATKLIESLDVFINMSKYEDWYRYIKKNTPAERMMTMLTFCHDHIIKMRDILDPGEHEKPKENKKIDKQFYDIINMWKDSKLYLGAIKYAKGGNS